MANVLTTAAHRHSSIAHHFERVASSTLTALILCSLPSGPPSLARSIVRLGETCMARQPVLYVTKNRKHHLARTHSQLRILEIQRCIMAPFFLVISRVPLYQKAHCGAIFLLVCFFGPRYILASLSYPYDETAERPH